MSEPEMIARVNGDTAARVTGQGRSCPLYVFREGDQLYRWAEFYRDDPKETTQGIINHMNDPNREVEYIPKDEIPCSVEVDDAE